MNIGIVLAGGSGTRLGSETPKQYLKINDKPILIYSVEQFVMHEDIDGVVVTCPESWIDHTAELCRKYISDSEKILFTAGGSDRNESLMNAIDVIEENYKVDDKTVIVTHDGVRPFVTGRIITDNIDCALKFGACGTAVPSTDTILETDGDMTITCVPDRSRLFNAQTPQSFILKEFKEALLTLSEDEKKTLTDATKIYALKGKKVRVVPGEITNIKITYKTDLIMAEAIIKSMD